MKATSSLIGPGGSTPLPPGCEALTHEVELVAVVGARNDGPLSPFDAIKLVTGYGVGIDYTDRRLQRNLRSQGHPWSRAKSFRGAAALSDIVPASSIMDPQDLELSLWVNDERRQHGCTRDLSWTVGELVSFLTQSNDLHPGDLIFTGTPAGVGPVVPGDICRVALVGHIEATFSVVPPREGT